MATPKNKKKSRLTKAQKKRQAVLARWRQKWGPVAVLAAALIIGYASYQLFLAEGVRLIVNEVRSEPLAGGVGCTHDGEPSVPPKQLAPAEYQQFIRNQKATSGNLVQNASLQVFNAADDAPTGFSRITVADWATYETKKEDSNPYLRTTTARVAADGEAAAGWIMRNVPVERDGTYAYNFEYRSTVPVTVSLEYTLPDATVVYQNVTELDPQDNWQRFTYYARNDRAATAMRFIVVSRAAGRVDTRSFDLHRIADARLPAGMVSIAFDDGWQSIADKALPMLEARDLPTTQYIISNASTDKPIEGYMSSTTVREFKDKGHEIGSHTLAHCDQTHLSDKDIRKNALDSKKALKDAGLGPITTLAYPYGQHNEVTRRIVGPEYDFLRSSDAGFNDRYFDAKNIRSQGILDTTTEAELQSWLDYARVHRVWVVLVYHRVDETGEYSITSEQLARQLDLIKASGLQVVPVGEAAQAIRQ